MTIEEQNALATLGQIFQETFGRMMNRRGGVTCVTGDNLQMR